MASSTMRFPVNSTTTEAFPRCNSISGFIGTASRSSSFSKLLFIRRTANSHALNLTRTTSSFSVNCVSLQDPDPQLKQEATTSLSSFAPDASSIASSIKYHAEFTPLFSPENFHLPQAFFATAQSVRDTLLINWNATYDYYEKLNVKQAYYLSMEFLQGRALLNAIGNLELNGPYAEALSKLGHKLEDVAGQEPDAALGNGGLGRLASCFLDSLATLNYPAWGYGLRYKYGLFKQLITKDGQEEVAEDWLEMGSPWEIIRNDVSYPVKFYGKVISGSDGKKHWTGGEDIKAIAHDVPIPGYKTKTTINLRLWSTKAASEDFDLYAFNSGKHTEANEALANAEKICYILYPGDESTEGKILRLKQQYTLCSASLQDIIARFERRSGASVNWEEFPEKVAVQMNDTHPTLCIPELMRILIDVKGLSWKDAWNITQRTVAYTNHTVLPEALEKWSLELMQKLLPRHVEIIEMIDEELIRTIIAEYGTEDSELLGKKLKEMRILDNVELPAEFAGILVKEAIDIPSEELQNSEQEVDEENHDEEVEETIAKQDGKDKISIEDKKEELPEPVPEPPKVVRMANLCVVGGHAVNGVAEIHSEIVKDEVFNAFYKLWPEKFQNKTNGVTPRRWIKFCNPDLSKIITEWIGTEDWVLNTERLSELRKFADNEDLQMQWREAKRNNKIKVAAFLREKTGYSVSPDAMFDIQCLNRKQLSVQKLQAQRNEAATVGNSNSAPLPVNVASSKEKEDYNGSVSCGTVADASSISTFMAQVSDLVKLVDSRDIVELQLKQSDCELMIRKREALHPPPAPAVAPASPSFYYPPLPSSPSPPPVAASAPVSSPPSKAAPALPSPGKESKSSHPPLKCPMAGTFYRSPAPGEPPFVKVGDKVQKGQVICIIEAMKLMNEIEADQSGTITEIVAEDGKPVSVDAPLFVIAP